MERLKTFNVSISKGKHRRVLTTNSLQKLNFRSNILYVTIADADIGSLKSLHTLFDKYLDHMLIKFE